MYGCVMSECVRDVLVCDECVSVLVHVRVLTFVRV